MFAIKDVIKLLTKIFVKQNKRFPKGLEGVDIRIKAKEIHDVGKSQGYKGAISEDQLKQFLAFEKQQKAPPYRVIAGDSPEGKIITDKINLQIKVHTATLTFLKVFHLLNLIFPNPRAGQ